MTAELTDRDLEVLRLIAAGRTNLQIATHLSLTEDAVKSRVRAILSKTGSTNRTQAAAWARDRSLDFPPPRPGAPVRDLAPALRVIVRNWDGRAPAALLTELRRLSGDQPAGRAS